MWASDWGPEARYAYKQGIKKGRKLEYEEQLDQANRSYEQMAIQEHKAQTRTERLIKAIERLTVQLEGLADNIKEDDEEVKEVITTGPTKAEILFSLEGTRDFLAMEGMRYSSKMIEKTINYIKENVND